MKIIPTILLLVVMTFASSATSAEECSLRDLEAKVIDCNEEAFSVKINFLHEEADTNYFELRGNGRSYGKFRYGTLPLTLQEIELDPTIKYEFVVIDSLRKDCVSDVPIGKVSCYSCGLGPLTLVKDSCYNGLRSIAVDMEYTALDSEDTLKFLLNWEYQFDFTVEDLPLTFDSLDGSKTYYHIKAIDPKQPDCYVKRELEVVNCEPMLGLLDITPLECNADSTYQAKVDFGYANIDSVSIAINDSLYGTFATADLPLVLKNVVTGNGSTDHFTVCALHEEACCIDRKVISPCAVNFCHMFRPVVQYLACDSGSYFVEIDFDVEGLYTDSFGIDANGEQLGKFAYADLPVKVGPFTSDEWTDHYLLFYDLDNHDCCTEYLMDGQLCPAQFNISEAKLGDCRDDGSFSATLTYEGFGFLHVDLYLDGEYIETYCIDENPIVLDSIYAAGSMTSFKLCPSGVDADCAKVTLEVPAGCRTEACGFSALEYDVVDCDSSQFYLKLKVGPPVEHDDHFVVEGPDFREELLYAEGKHLLGPFSSGEYYEFHVIETKSDCVVELPLGRIVCEKDCDLTIGDITATCIESSFALVDIDSVGAAHGAFDIWIDEEPLGFVKQSEFPIQYEVKNKSEYVIVKICISDNNTCCHEVKVKIDPCLIETCSLGEMSLDTTGCEEEGFFVKLNLTGAQPDRGLFHLMISDSLAGEYSFVDLPLRLGPFSPGESLNFRVMSLLDSSCTVSKELPAITCQSKPDGSAGEQIVVLRCQGLDRFVKVPAILHEPTAMYLFDINGMMVERLDISSDSRYVALNISRPPSGLYVLRLHSSAGQVSKKVVIP